MTTLLATFLNSVGMIMFKLAHLKSEKDEGYYVLTWQYISGLFIIIFASLISTGINSSMLYL